MEALVQKSFRNAYKLGCMEYFVLYKLCDDPNFLPELSLVMEKDNIIIGQNCFVRV